MQYIKPGTYITITERKCSDKVQPNIRLGDTFVVEQIDHTSKGVLVLIAHDKDNEKRVVRCNAQRFRWVSVDFYNRKEFKPNTGKLKQGHIIIITAKYVERHIQCQVQVNEMYGVDKVKRFADGHSEITVYTLNRSHLTYKLSSERYHWERLVVGDLMKSINEDEQKHQNIKKMFTIARDTEYENSKNKLFQDFTFAEKAKIAYVPLIVYYIAWQYADKTTACAARLKASETLKLSRAIRMLREKYIDYLRQDLDTVHLNQIREQAKRFMSDHATYFAQLYYTVLNSINHQHIGITYDELRAYAFITKMLLSFLYEFENQLTDFIRQRLGSASVAHLPHNTALSACMDAYLGDYKITVTRDVEIAMRVFVNEINKIEYVIKS